MHTVLLVRVRILAVATVCLLLTGCPLPKQVVNAVQAALPPTATIGTAYTGSVPAASKGWTRGTVTLPPGSWMNYNAATGAITGTPDGNDFGIWPVTVAFTKGTTTKSLTQNIVVADPTLTWTPVAGYTVPFQSTDTVAITIAPVPPTAYTYTYGHRILTGQANTTVSGPTTSATGTENITLSWNFGGDFTGNVLIRLTSAAPGGRVLTLAPIPSKSQ